MPVDIRAAVSCLLGTVISGNVNDDYVQGAGLIKCSGNVVISGIITPAIGTAVTFSYTKSGVTRTIPRKLRVLSSFADPFRRTTSVELGCKLTYLSDKRDSIDWTAFDDTENTLTEADAEIITIPIRAQAVAKKCMDELGISGTFTLTNKFSIPKFDLSPGYVQVLGDLLVSESLCGYLDANETLQVFSLDQAGGTGPVLDATQLVDISKIGVGQLPGESVVVSYSSLKLKRDVSQTGGNTGEATGAPGWDGGTKTSTYQVLVPYKSPSNGSSQIASYNILETTTTTTTYATITTRDGQTSRLPVRRVTEFSTLDPSVIGNQYSEYLSNGIPIYPGTIQKTTTESFGYNADGFETYYEKYEQGGLGFLLGSASVPLVFSPTDYVSFGSNITIELGREVRETLISGGSSQVTTTTYGHWYKTLTGQQAIAQGRVSLSNSNEVADYLLALIEIGLCLVDTRTDIESVSRPRSAPTRAQINNATNAKGGTPSNGYRTESKSSLELALGSATAQRRIELSLPYAPDDTFIKAAGTYSSVASDAPQKAQLYGRVQNRLLLGNRNGMNVQAAPEVLPAAPFAPFVIRSGSTSALYRTNGSNWTFDAQGLVASTDALFWGGVGGNAGQSWFPIAPGITTLPTAPATTTVNITDASGNVVSSYEQMVVTGTVPVAQETRLLQATARVQPVITSLPYALQQTAEVAITTKAKAAVSSIKPINVPAAAITVAALAPTVSTGAAVKVPAAAVTVEALAPVVSSGASVQPPAAGLTLEGLAPELVGRPKTIIAGPAAEITVAALAPTVSTGAAVLVPAAEITVAALTPSIEIAANDTSFSSVSLLLHMDGSNGSTTFTDKSSNALSVTAAGNAAISTTQSKYGGASAYFDGSGDYLSVASSTVLDLTGDFTIEFFVYPAVAMGSIGFIARPNASSISPIRIDVASSAIRLSASSDAATFTTIASGGLPSATTWTHVAVTRSSNTWRIFVGGTQTASATSSLTPFTSTNPMIIGARLTSSNFFNGYIDELRITKGIARYTANFTPPTAPFPDA